MIEFDEWRENVYDPEGELIKEDVLHIRAREGMYTVFTLVWDEDPQEIADIKALLTAAVDEKASYGSAP